MLVIQGAISLYVHDVQPRQNREKPNDTNIAMHFNCHHKQIADSDDDHMTPVLDDKYPGVRQPQHRILQWNSNDINRELPLLGGHIKATNMDVVCIKETNL